MEPVPAAEGFSPATKTGWAAVCELLLLAKASWHCSLPVQWQHRTCFMDFLGTWENSAFGLTADIFTVSQQ